MMTMTREILTPRSVWISYFHSDLNINYALAYDFIIIIIIIIIIIMFLFY